MVKVIDIFKATLIFFALVALAVVVSKFDPENPHEFTGNTPVEASFSF